MERRPHHLDSIHSVVIQDGVTRQCRGQREFGIMGTTSISSGTYTINTLPKVSES